MSKKGMRILVPLDGSKNSFRGLDKAISLAKQSESFITGIFVVPNLPSELDAFRAIVNRSIHKQYDNFTKKAKEKCSKNGVDFIDIIEFGEEGSRIVSYAKKNNFDLIVMGSRGLGSVSEFFLGSTSKYVLHKSKIPVMIVK
jgi:nucleotide-binding universal stress UspA family protein